MHRIPCLLLLSSCLLATGVVRAQSVPYVPADDATVLARQAVPKQGIAGLRALRLQQRQLAADPQNLPLATGFARAAITLGRAEADPRYFGYAEAALRPWSALPQPPPDALLLRATLRQQRHDFAGALSDLDTLIASDGSNAQARLTRALVRMVQGRPGDGLRDCAALVSQASFLTTATCIAEARRLDGHADAARQTLETALADPRTTTAAIDERIWAETTAAELSERRADDASAERHFHAALDTLAAAGQRDPYLLVAWADFLIAHQRAAEAVSLLADATRIDNALLRLALAESATRDAKLDEHLRLLQARFDETRQRGDTVHLREETMFELSLRKNPAKAVMLATQNWQSQREPADARLLLQAALEARQPSAAQPVLDWLQQTGIEDPKLRALAAMLVNKAAAR